MFAYGPADATASQNPIISCLIEIQTGFTLYRLTQVGPEKRPLNGCVGAEFSAICFIGPEYIHTLAVTPPQERDRSVAISLSALSSVGLTARVSQKPNFEKRFIHAIW